MTTFVSNANVASNAAIVVTKLIQGGTNEVLFSNGGSNLWSGAPTLTSLSATTFLAIGSSPATTGGLRITNNFAIIYHNAAGDADLAVLNLNSSNNVVAGNDTSTNFDIRAATNLRTFSGGTQILQLGRTASDFIQLGGTNPADAGQLRFSHNNSFQGRNSLNDANRNLLSWGATTNVLALGDANNAGLTIGSGGNIGLTSPTTTIDDGYGNLWTIVGGASITASGITSNKTISAGSGVITPLDSAPSFTISGWDTTESSKTGGALTLRGGNGDGATSTGGALVLDSGTGTSTHGLVTVRNGGADVVAFGPAADAALATAGTIRLPHGSTIQAATSGGIARTLVDWGVTTTDQLFFGEANVITTFRANSTGLFFQTGGSNRLVIQNTALTIQAAVNLQFAITHTAPTILQADITTNGVTGSALQIHAQNATGTTTTGGTLDLRSGTGTTTAGEVTIRRGATTVIATNASSQLILSSTGGITLSNAVSCGSSVTVNGGGGNFWTLVGGTSFTGSGTNTKLILAGSSSIATGPAFAVQGYNTTGTSQTGGSLTLQGGISSGSNSTGGDLILKPGTGVSVDGYVRVQLPSSSNEWLFVGVGSQSAFWIGADVTNPEVRHLPALTATDFTIQAQDSFGGGTIGGSLVLRAGSGLSGDGAVKLRSNGVQVCVNEFRTDQVAVGFFKDIVLDDITGNADKVIYVGEVGTEPTTSTPVGGFLHYCNNGNPSWKTPTGGGELPFTTDASAGTHATYMRVIIGGTTYKIDLLADA